jgi:hypothetical protein
MRFISVLRCMHTRSNFSFRERQYHTSILQFLFVLRGGCGSAWLERKEGPPKTATLYKTWPGRRMIIWCFTGFHSAILKRIRYR